MNISIKRIFIFYQQCHGRTCALRSYSCRFVQCLFFSLSRFFFYFFIVFHLTWRNGLHGQSIRKLTNLTFTIMALICIINRSPFNIDCAEAACSKCSDYEMTNFPCLHSSAITVAVAVAAATSTDSFKPSIVFHHFRLPPSEWKENIWISISKQILLRINSPIHLRIIFSLSPLLEEKQNEKRGICMSLEQVQHFFLIFFLSASQFQHKSI